MYFRITKTIVAALFCLLAATATQAKRPKLADDLPLIDNAWSNDGDKFSFVILGDKTSGGEGEFEDCGAEAGGISPTETMLHRVSGLYTYL